MSMGTGLHRGKNKAFQPECQCSAELAEVTGAWFSGNISMT